MEVWKDIKEYKDYQVSNLGNVRSLKYKKIRQLNPSISNGYLHVVLSKNGVLKTRTIHQLVAESFLNHNTCGHQLVVNHKDFNRQNNNIFNLELITQRDNTNQKHLKSSSIYVGVNWNKKVNKWESRIWINGKRKSLGFFTNEIEASKAYKKELNGI